MSALRPGDPVTTQEQLDALPDDTALVYTGTNRSVPPVLVKHGRFLTAGPVTLSLVDWERLLEVRLELAVSPDQNTSFEDQYRAFEELRDLEDRLGITD